VDEVVNDVSAGTPTLAVVPRLRARVAVVVGVRRQVEARRGLEGRKPAARRRLRGLGGPGRDGPQGSPARGPCVGAVEGRRRKYRVRRRRKEVTAAPRRRRQVRRRRHRF